MDTPATITDAKPSMPTQIIYRSALLLKDVFGISDNPAPLTSRQLSVASGHPYLFLSKPVKVSYYNYFCLSSGMFSEFPQ